MDPSAASLYYEEALNLPEPPREQLLGNPFEYAHQVRRTMEMATEALDPDDYAHAEECEAELLPAPKQPHDDGLSPKETKTIESMLDISSRVFSKRRYIATQFRHSNFEQLVEDVGTLAEEEADAHNTIRSTVHENLETFISAKREMDEVYTNDRELFTGEATEQLLTDYTNVVQAVKSKESPLGKAGASIVNMIRVRSVFEKAQDFLTVPALVYATCGAEVLPPLPEEVLSAIGRTNRSGGGVGGGGASTSSFGQNADSDEGDSEDEDDAEDTYSDELSSDESNGSSASSTSASRTREEDEDGGLSRLIAKHVPRDTFVFRNVLLRPIDFDGDAARPQEVGQNKDVGGTASRGASPSSPAGASASVNAPSGDAKHTPSTSRRKGPAMAPTPGYLIALANERNFENAVIHVSRCLLFLEDNYDLLTGLPKRVHSQSDAAAVTAVTMTTGSPLSPAGANGGLASSEAIARRKREAKQEARRRKSLAAAGATSGGISSGAGGSSNALLTRKPSARFASFRDPVAKLIGGGAGDDDEDEDDSDEDGEKESSDVELEAILNMGEGAHGGAYSAVGGIPKTAISAGDAPLPDELAQMKQINIERSRRFALYIAEKQFIFRFVMSLLTASIFLSECLNEELSRSSADSDTILIEESIANLVTVCTHIVKLRHFAMELRHRLRIAQPIKARLHAQLQTMRERAAANSDGGSEFGDGTESMMSRSDYFGSRRRGSHNDEDGDEGGSNFGGTSRGGGSSRRRGGGGGSDGDDAASFASSVYDAEGQLISENKRGRRGLFGAAGGGGGGGGGGSFFGGLGGLLSSSSARARSNLLFSDSTFMQTMLKSADDLLGPSPTAFLKWRPTARGALRRPILHPVETYLAILQQQHASAVRSACEALLDPALRVMKKTVLQFSKAEAAAAAAKRKRDRKRNGRLQGVGAGGDSGDEDSDDSSDDGDGANGRRGGNRHATMVNNSSIFGGGDNLKDSVVFGVGGGGGALSDIQALLAKAKAGGSGTAADKKANNAGGGAAPADAVFFSPSGSPPQSTGGAAATAAAEQFLTAEQIRRGCLPSASAQDALKQLQSSLTSLQMTSIIKGLLTPPASLGVLGGAPPPPPPIASDGPTPNPFSSSSAAASASAASSASNSKNFGIRGANSILSVHASINGTDITPIIASTATQIMESDAAERCLQAMREGSETVGYFADDYCSRNPPLALSLLSQILLSSERIILNYWCGIGSSAVHKGAFDFAPNPPEPNSELAGGPKGGEGSKSINNPLEALNNAGGLGGSNAFEGASSSFLPPAAMRIGEESTIAAQAAAQAAKARRDTALAVMAVTAATSNRTPFKPRRAKDVLRRAAGDVFEELDNDTTTETLQLHDRHLRNIAQWLSDASRLLVYPNKPKVRLLSQGNALRALREAAAAAMSTASAAASLANQLSSQSANTTKTPTTANATATTIATATAEDPTPKIEVLLKLLPAPHTDLALDTHRFVPTCRFVPVSNLPALLIAARTAQLSGQGDDDDDEQQQQTSAAAATAAAVAAAPSLRIRSVATIRSMIRHMADSAIQILRGTIGHCLAKGILSSAAAKEERTILLEMFIAVWERMVLRCCDSIIRLKSSLLAPPPTTRSISTNTATTTTTVGVNGNVGGGGGGGGGIIGDAASPLPPVFTSPPANSSTMDSVNNKKNPPTTLPQLLTACDAEDVLLFLRDLEDMRSRVMGIYLVGLGVAARAHISSLALTMCGVLGGTSSASSSAEAESGTAGAGAHGGAYAVDDHFNPMTGSFRAVGGMGSNSTMRSSTTNFNRNGKEGGGGAAASFYGGGGSYSSTMMGGGAGGAGGGGGSQESQQQHGKAAVIHNDRSLTLLCRLSRLWTSTELPVIISNLMYLMGDRCYDAILRIHEVSSKQRNVFTTGVPAGVSTSTSVAYVNTAALLLPSPQQPQDDATAAAGSGGGFVLGDPSSSSSASSAPPRSSNTTAATTFSSAAQIDPSLALHRAIELMNTTSIAVSRDGFSAMLVDVFLAGVDAIVEVGRYCGAGDSPMLLSSSSSPSSVNNGGGGLNFNMTAAASTLNVAGLSPEEVLLLRGVRRQQQRHRRLILSECIADLLCLHRAVFPIVVNKLLAGEVFSGCVRVVLQNGAAARGEHEVKSLIASSVADFNARGGAAPSIVAAQQNNSNSNRGGGNAEDEEEGGGGSAEGNDPSSVLSPSVIIGDVTALGLSTLIDQYVSVARSDITLEVQTHGFAHPRFDWQRHYFGFSGGGGSGSPLSSSVGIRSFITDALTHVARAHESIFRIQSSSSQSSAEMGVASGSHHFSRRAGTPSSSSTAATAATTTTSATATSVSSSSSPFESLPPATQVRLVCFQVAQRLVAHIGKCIMAVLTSVGGGDTGGLVGFEMGSPLSMTTNGNGAKQGGGQDTEKGVRSASLPTTSLCFEVYGLMIIEAELLFIYSLLERLKVATLKVIDGGRGGGASSSSSFSSTYIHPELKSMLFLIPRAVQAIQQRGRAACDYVCENERFGPRSADVTLAADGSPTPPPPQGTVGAISSAERAQCVDSILASARYASHYITEAICGAGSGAESNNPLSSSSVTSSTSMATLLQQQRSASAIAAGGVGGNGLRLSRHSINNNNSAAGSLASRLERQEASRREVVVGASASSSAAAATAANAANSRLSRSSRRGGGGGGEGSAATKAEDIGEDTTKTAAASADSANAGTSLAERRIARRLRAQQKEEGGDGEGGGGGGGHSDGDQPLLPPPTASASAKSRATTAAAAAAPSSSSETAAPPPKALASSLRGTLKRSHATTTAAGTASAAGADGLVVTKEEAKRTDATTATAASPSPAHQRISRLAKATAAAVAASSSPTAKDDKDATITAASKGGGDDEGDAVIPPPPKGPIHKRALRAHSASAKPDEEKAASGGGGGEEATTTTTAKKPSAKRSLSKTRTVSTAEAAATTGNADAADASKTAATTAKSTTAKSTRLSRAAAAASAAMGSPLSSEKPKRGSSAKRFDDVTPTSSPSAATAAGGSDATAAPATSLRRPLARRKKEETET